METEVSSICESNISGSYNLSFFKKEFYHFRQQKDGLPIFHLEEMISLKFPFIFT